MKKLEFQRRVKNSLKPIVIDFWAPWCTPCKVMDPAFKETSEKYKGKVDVLKINSDESTEVMKELGVMSIPTVIGFANGKEILRRSGMQTLGMLDFFFDATQNQKKPAIMPPAPATRVIRTIIGLVILALGWFWNQSAIIMVIGGLVVFSGFYDRCPIIKALTPKVKSLFSRTD